MHFESHKPEMPMIKLTEAFWRSIAWDLLNKPICHCANFLSSNASKTDVCMQLWLARKWKQSLQNYVFLSLSFPGAWVPNWNWFAFQNTNVWKTVGCCSLLFWFIWLLSSKMQMYFFAGFRARPESFRDRQTEERSRHIPLRVEFLVEEALKLVRHTMVSFEMT